MKQTGRVIRMATAFALAALAFATCTKPLPMPGQAIPESPADSAVTRSSLVTFIWQPVAQAAAYELQIAGDSRLSKVVADETVAVESVTVELGMDGEYFWRLRARSTGEVWGEWSEVRALTVERFRIVAGLKTQGYPHDIAVAGARACVADGQAGLALFDISSPESPVFLAQKMDSLNEAWGVAVSDSFAYVSYGNKELYIVNVSRPESLKVAGEVEYYQPAYGFDIAVSDTFVYIAADAQFIILNVAAPQWPLQILQTRYPHSTRGVALWGPWCYLACEQLGVAVWKWNHDSTPPAQVGGFDTPSNAQSVAAGEGFLCVADGRNGLIVADLADPARPVPVATLALDGYARGVTVKDSLAYVGCGSGGLAVVDLKEPTGPRLLARLPLPYCSSAQAEGAYIYAVDRDSGLVVIKAEE